MPESNADDLDVLLAFREVAVGQEVIPVRELSFMQGLRLGPALAPLVADIAEHLGDFQAIEDAHQYIDILLAVFGRHEQLTTLLIAEATGKPVEWVRKIGSDGEELLLTLWLVNRAFFLRRLHAANRRKTSRMESASA